MTAPIKKLSPSVDYTSRDYAALREELIIRMKSRIPEWTGNDPADFGLAIIESFAYMGDLVNYYVDRIANESYLLTATQRQSLLNLASMYGYYPKGYVSATTDVTFTNGYGYYSDTGAGIIASDGTCSLVVRNDHPFVVGNLVTIKNSTIPAYNGLYAITSLTEASLDPSGDGHNVISYKPEFSITGYTLTTTGSGGSAITTIEFQCNNNLAAGGGQGITVTGVVVAVGGGTDINKTWTTVSATPTSFTVQTNAGTTIAGTHTWVVGGTVTYQARSVDATTGGTAYQYGFTIIPAGTQLTTEVVYQDAVEQVVFSATNDIAVPYQGSATNQLIQGENISYRQENAADSTILGDISGELLGVSTGVADQYFPLMNDRVDLTFLEVYVEDVNTYSLWQQVDHLSDWDANARVYTAVTDADGIVYVAFGDGVTGAVPPVDSKIKAVYFTGGGEIGNVGENLLAINTVPGVTLEQAAALRDTTRMKVTHPAARGGADPESDDSIRYNAPRTLRVQNRAVTKQDFADLAMGVAGVGKAKAESSIWSSVTVYVAPSQSVSSQNTSPVPTQALLDSVGSYLADRVQIGTTVTVASPKYTPVYVSVLYAIDSNFSATKVKKDVYDAIVNGLSYSNVDFGQTFTPGYIEYLCRFVQGVTNVKVTRLSRETDGGVNTLIGAPDEIFVFTQANTELNAASNVATLDSLSLSSVTLSPAFSSSNFVYTATVANTVAYTTVVPTVTDGSASASVNNKQYTGTGISVDLVTGLNLINVIVTAGDGSTASAYVIAITKTA